MTDMRLRFDLVDVFTDRPFAGNQLAVVHGAEDLDAEQCLQLAAEFHFSETAFPGAVVDGAYPVRIFTPAGEIPFAGHPTLGTAWVLRSHGLLVGNRVTQMCGSGPVPVSFHDDLVELTVSPRDSFGPVDVEVSGALLADVGLRAGDLAGPAWVAGCGLTFVHVPVGLKALGRARASATALAGYAERLGGSASDPVEGVNLVHLMGDSGRSPALRVRSRVFVPGLSVPEDAATGSAAAGLGVALVAWGTLPDGGAYQISQGLEMGRPSLLHGRVEAEDGTATRCHVAGRVRHVASGEIAVPLS
jgi:trans-2,3-dihydro-3-hydroxyanthranilate isomerase